MRRPRPSDMTAEQWADLEPLIPVPAVGRPRGVSTREALDVIFYQARSGCQWDVRNSRGYEQYAHAGGSMTRVSPIHRMRRFLQPDETRKPVPFKYRGLQPNLAG